jgi:hypothetical protein
MATTGAWPEALAYLSEHRRALPRLRAARPARRPTPDLRAVEYLRVDVIRPAVNGHRTPASLRRLVAGALHSLVRVVVGAFSTSA